MLVGNDPILTPFSSPFTDSKLVEKKQKDEVFYKFFFLLPFPLPPFPFHKKKKA
jgi:hypothetical protein